MMPTGKRISTNNDQVQEPQGKSLYKDVQTPHNAIHNKHSKLKPDIIIQASPSNFSFKDMLMKPFRKKSYASKGPLHIPNSNIPNFSPHI